MTKKEQIELIRAKTKNITDDMIKNVREGKVPEQWDGFEFRHWLNIIVNHEDILADRIRNKPYRKRKRDCENTIIVNNLY